VSFGTVNFRFDFENDSVFRGWWHAAATTIDGVTIYEAWQDPNPKLANETKPGNKGNKKRALAISRASGRKGTNDFDTTRESFESGFIEQIQTLAVDAAAERKVLYVPQNHVDRFYTADFIVRLARAIKCPRKRSANHFARLYLALCWEQKGLDRLDRKDLAEHVNKECGTKIKPGAIWQMAYRDLDLFTQRPPGPKPRS
jgi:hypothetical protein